MATSDTSAPTPDSVQHHNADCRYGYAAAIGGCGFCYVCDGSPDCAWTYRGRSGLVTDGLLVGCRFRNYYDDESPGSPGSDAPTPAVRGYRTYHRWRLSLLRALHAVVDAVCYPRVYLRAGIVGVREHQESEQLEFGEVPVHRRDMGRVWGVPPRRPGSGGGAGREGSGGMG